MFRPSISSSLIVAKLKAACLHAVLTLLIALISAVVVFRIWYPHGLAAHIGGVDLYWLILGVEVCLGPLMSLVIYNPAKLRPELVRDYLIIGAVQLAALVFGLHSTFVSRPVFEVFVIDRLEIVSAVELDDEDRLAAVVEQFKSLPLTGPIKACVAMPSDKKERSDILMSALRGKDVQLMPKYYKKCADGEVIRKAMDANILIEGLKQMGRYDRVVDQLPSGDFKWLPVQSRFGAWVEVYPGGNESRSFYVSVDPFQ